MTKPILDFTQQILNAFPNHKINNPKSRQQQAPR